MLKGALKDREFNSIDEIKEAVTKVWDELCFDPVQSAFHNWINCPAWMTANGESILLNKYEMISSRVVNLKIGGGRELSLHPVFRIISIPGLSRNCRKDDFTIELNQAIATDFSSVEL
jgi:hypothetical protein